MPTKLALLIAVSGVSALAQSTNGIWVDQPKVYDDYFLQSQLNALRAQLSGLSGLNQTALSSSIGSVQGATLQASGINAQALGPAPPQVTTLTPPSGGAVTGATGAYGTTTTGPTVTPSVPTAPQTSLTPPSTLSQSSINTLGEMMQLSYQIINYQLLLDGSLSDQYAAGSQAPKRRVTVGLSITVDPPEGLKKQLKNALAEVVITIESPSKNADLPSVVTLLPREKTYNVIGMVDHQLSLGAGGVLAGMVNLGLSWTLQRQKAYIYQQQDTLALETGPSTFAWQFRPVLDKPYVSSGTRQMFVQFSVPQLKPDQPRDCSAFLEITTRWRKIDPKTGLAGEVLAATPTREFTVPFYDARPITEEVDVADIGGGMVRVSALGRFVAQGMRVRIGGTILDQNSPNVQVRSNAVVFQVPAQDLLTGGAFLLGRDGSENQIQNGLKNQPLGPCEGPIPKEELQFYRRTSEPNFSIDSIVFDPYSDSQVLVTVKIKNPPPDVVALQGRLVVNPLIVAIGGQVFGLQNNPFRSLSADTISFLAPTDLIKAQEILTVEQLLQGPSARASLAFDLNKYPKNGFSVSSTSIVYASEQTLLLLNGLGLDGATIVDASNPVVPPPDDKTKADPSKHCLAATDSTHSAYMVVSIEKGCASLMKEFLLAKTGNPPITVTVPKPDAAKPALKASATVAPGDKVLKLTGDGIDQVTLVRFGKTVLTPTLSLDKKSLTIPLTPDITMAEGIRFLEFEMADGSKVRFTLTVKKSAN